MNHYAIMNPLSIIFIGHRHLSSVSRDHVPSAVSGRYFFLESLKVILFHNSRCHHFSNLMVLIQTRLFTVAYLSYIFPIGQSSFVSCWRIRKQVRTNNDAAFQCNILFNIFFILLMLSFSIELYYWFSIDFTWFCNRFCNFYNVVTDLWMDR